MNATEILEKLELCNPNKRSTETAKEPAVEPKEPIVETIVETAKEPVVEPAVKRFTIPPTCDKLETIPKNVHYITEAPDNMSFVVVINEEPHLENPDRFRRQILKSLRVYIDEGDPEYAIDNLRDHWPYWYDRRKEGGWTLEPCKNKVGRSVVEGFWMHLKPLTFMNGTLVFDHEGEQYRLQLTPDVYKSFTFYCCKYSIYAEVSTKNEQGKEVTSYEPFEISYWVKCSFSYEETNKCNARVKYKDLVDKLTDVVDKLMGQDSEESSNDDTKIKFLQGEYRETPKHDFVDYDGNPCGAMEYYCSKTWTNEHYTLMTQKGDRAWDVYRWIIGYITSMDFMSKSVKYRHFIWFACCLSSIGKSKMIEKCFSKRLICDPNPTDGEDTFSKRESLSCPLLIADDGDLVGLAKNKSYLTRLNKRVGNGTIPTRLMHKEEIDIARTVFNMTLSNVEPPKELIAGDTTNILTSKCRYVYVNLSDAIYHDDSTSILNIQDVALQIGSEIPDKYRQTNLYDAEVDLFKSDCLRFYKANPNFMDKYLGAMKQANTSGAKTCFEDYIDAAEGNNSWGCDYENDKIMPLGMLFRKQLRCEDDFALLKSYFCQWALEHHLEYGKARGRINGVTKNAAVQPMVSKDMILKTYNM